MSTTIKSEEWFSIIQKEYLQDFISRGGSAVKFIIPEDVIEINNLGNNLQNIANNEGFHYVHVDAATTKIHMVEQLFFGVSKHIDWDNLAYEYLRRLLSETIKLPTKKDNFNIREIAALNGSEVREMYPNINKMLTKNLFRNYDITQEFRIAMLRLCQNQLNPDYVDTDLCTSIKAWLKGELKTISALKSALIFQKISRHNARHMLFSLAHWLKMAGKSGLFMVIDISRYLQGKPTEPDGTYYYSTTAVLDCYEVLRQFIDGTDEAKYCLIVVVATPQFLNPDNSKRGINAYDALKFRIWDEVYDR
ncbi:MAG: BREX system ATP-binding domain-containing protein, partial [Patescibacteria group bacterium]